MSEQSSKAARQLEEEVRRKLDEARKCLEIYTAQEVDMSDLENFKFEKKIQDIRWSINEILMYFDDNTSKLMN